jgi:FAD/FMN-containing dehydrogenase/Fe-S oxidoreductase
MQAILPILKIDPNIEPSHLSFFDALIANGYQGEISTEYAQRIVGSTDNSIYQILPHAILMPKNHEDVVIIMRLIAKPEFRHIYLTARGGGTGTNGQSLNHGLIVDMRKYCNHILEFNQAEQWITVQAGVVLDQLNDFLKEQPAKDQTLFFAPNLSPSNRATIGGMINTDAAGEGSRIYGKTSEHVLEVKAVFLGGHEKISDIQMTALSVLFENNQQIIEEDLPKLKRFVTGYDLVNSYQDHSLNLTRLLCGAEGSLCIITEAKLKLTKKFRYSKMLVLKYQDFDSALGDTDLILKYNPNSIETVDHRIIEVAKNNPIFNKIKGILSENIDKIKAIHLVEFQGNDKDDVSTRFDACKKACIDQNHSDFLGHSETEEEDVIEDLWDFRKKSVGLLAKLKLPDDKQPIAFVEDTVVPPEKLQAYIREFRAILDQEKVNYGMFGHVDVGCLHVRPALNMREKADEDQLLRISNAVFELTRKYGGVIWGEHGKGFRSAYSPQIFGPRLYPMLQQIKAIFDPFGQLNPGKIATPNDQTQLVSIQSSLRGAQDRLIHHVAQKDYDLSIRCNGNGQCLDYDHNHLMCPSSHVSRNRIHTPKGRAGVMREWLKQISIQSPGYIPSRQTAALSSHWGTFKWIKALAQAKWYQKKSSNLFDPQVTTKISQAKTDFNHEVYDAMSGCLSCKACATACPVKVDIPDLKSQFLAMYHSRYPRPIHDFMVAGLEHSLKYMGMFPKVSNFKLRLFSPLIQKLFGMVDIPLLDEKNLEKELQSIDQGDKKSIFLSTLEKMPDLIQQTLGQSQNTQDHSHQAVILILDAFHQYYEVSIVKACVQLLVALGLKVFVVKDMINGKALHVKGFLSTFHQIVKHNQSYLKQLADTKLKMICLEPAVALTFSDEYPKILGIDQDQDPKAIGFKVELLQVWLDSYLSHHQEINQNQENQKFSNTLSYALYSHCTERTFVSSAPKDWENIFKKFGICLSLKEVGCCGMCGAFGHEADHYEESKAIFEQSWQKSLDQMEAIDDASKTNLSELVLTTGYSCRSQVKRFKGFKIKNPVEILVNHVSNLLKLT